jgi:6-phosphogluconolactonase
VGTHRSVIVYADPAAVAETTGARLLIAIGDAIAKRGVAHVVLTGGTVGIELLRRAAATPLASTIDWTSVHVWWGDERFVPAGHPDRNEGQAQDALLRHVPLPEENIHRIGSSDQFATVLDAASAYYSLIAQWDDPQWDVAMFGMGPDGHVASLFPGLADIPAEHVEFDDAAPRALPVVDSPKPPAERVTMTLSTINHARCVWIVATGAEKAPAVADALKPGSTLPAAAIGGTQETLWLVDAAASTQV